MSRKSNWIYLLFLTVYLSTDFRLVQADCNPPATRPGVKISPDKSVYQQYDRIILSCEGNASLHGISPDAGIFCEDTDWNIPSFSNIHCLDDCSLASLGDGVSVVIGGNATVEGGFVPHGSFATFDCDGTVSVYNTSYCSNGTWSHPLPTCIQENVVTTQARTTSRETTPAVASATEGHTEPIIQNTTSMPTTVEMETVTHASSEPAVTTNVKTTISPTLSSPTLPTGPPTTFEITSDYGGTTLRTEEVTKVESSPETSNYIQPSHAMTVNTMSTSTDLVPMTTNVVDKINTTLHYVTNDQSESVGSTMSQTSTVLTGTDKTDMSTDPFLQSKDPMNMSTHASTSSDTAVSREGLATTGVLANTNATQSTSPVTVDPSLQSTVTSLATQMDENVTSTVNGTFDDEQTSITSQNVPLTNVSTPFTDESTFATEKATVTDQSVTLTPLPGTDDRNTAPLDQVTVGTDSTAHFSSGVPTTLPLTENSFLTTTHLVGETDSSNMTTLVNSTSLSGTINPARTTQKLMLETEDFDVTTFEDGKLTSPLETESILKTTEWLTSNIGSSTMTTLTDAKLTSLSGTINPAGTTQPLMLVTEDFDVTTFEDKKMTSPLETESILKTTEWLTSNIDSSTMATLTDAKLTSLSGTINPAGTTQPLMLVTEDFDVTTFEDKKMTSPLETESILKTTEWLTSNIDSSTMATLTDTKLTSSSGTYNTAGTTQPVILETEDFDVTTFADLKLTSQQTTESILKTTYWLTSEIGTSTMPTLSDTKLTSSSGTYNPAGTTQPLILETEDPVTTPQVSETIFKTTEVLTSVMDSSNMTTLTEERASTEPLMLETEDFDLTTFKDTGLTSPLVTETVLKTTDLFTDKMDVSNMTTSSDTNLTSLPRTNTASETTQPLILETEIFDPTTLQDTKFTSPTETVINTTDPFTSITDSSYMTTLTDNKLTSLSPTETVLNTTDPFTSITDSSYMTTLTDNKLTSLSVTNDTVETTQPLLLETEDFDVTTFKDTGLTSPLVTETVLKTTDSFTDKTDLSNMTAVTDTNLTSLPRTNRPTTSETTLPLILETEIFDPTTFQDTKLTSPTETVTNTTDPFTSITDNSYMTTLTDNKLTSLSVTNDTVETTQPLLLETEDFDVTTLKDARLTSPLVTETVSPKTTYPLANETDGSYMTTATDTKSTSLSGTNNTTERTQTLMLETEDLDKTTFESTTLTSPRRTHTVYETTDPLTYETDISNMTTLADSKMTSLQVANSTAGSTKPLMLETEIFDPTTIEDRMTSPRVTTESMTKTTDLLTLEQDNPNMTTFSDNMLTSMAVINNTVGSTQPLVMKTTPRVTEIDLKSSNPTVRSDLTTSRDILTSSSATDSILETTNPTQSDTDALTTLKSTIPSQKITGGDTMTSLRTTKDGDTQATSRSTPSSTFTSSPTVSGHTSVEITSDDTQFMTTNLTMDEATSTLKQMSTSQSTWTTTVEVTASSSDAGKITCRDIDCELPSALRCDESSGEPVCICREGYFRKKGDRVCSETRSFQNFIRILSDTNGRGINYHRDLEDPTTDYFIELSALVCGAINAIYENSNVSQEIYIGCKVFRFRRGSVIADFVTYFSTLSNINPEESEALIKQGIEDGDVLPGSNLIVDSDVIGTQITDECSLGIDDCDYWNGVCTNEGSAGFSCQCKDGYKDESPELLPGRKCTRDVVNLPLLVSLLIITLLMFVMCGLLAIFYRGYLYALCNGDVYGTERTFTLKQSEMDKIDSEIALYPLEGHTYNAT